MKKYKKPIGKKPLSKFRSHSLSEIHETKDNPTISYFLCQINLFHLKFGKTPSCEYLAFIYPSFNLNDIQKAVKYMAHHDWFSIVTRGDSFKYHITNKFQKAFYHPCKEDQI